MESKIDIVGCNPKIIQFVTVISYKSYEDSHFGISYLVGNPLFTLKILLFEDVKETNESLYCVTYGMDYSNTFHNNVVTSHLFPKNAWALKITTYVTVHTACWNNFSSKMKNKEGCKHILECVNGDEFIHELGTLK